MVHKDEDIYDETNDNNERFLSSLISVLLSCSVLLGVLFWIYNEVNTIAISNIWWYVLLSISFVTTIWVCFFLFVYEFKKGYYLESSPSKYYHGVSVLSKFFANIALLSGSVGISLLLDMVIVSEIIAILSQDYYFIASFLILIVSLLGLYMPPIFFRIITKKKISLRFDYVLISYMLLCVFCFILPGMFVNYYFLSGETTIDMENVVDRDVKSIPVEIEMTGALFSDDEILNNLNFYYNIQNKISVLGPKYNNITDYRIPIMKVNLITNNSNSKASNEMDSIYFFNLTSCNESRFLSGCGKGNGKFDINFTIENLDIGKYQLIIERQMDLKYIKDVEIN